jgi:nucleotide-binding universal stress UspA family protein
MEPTAVHPPEASPRPDEPMLLDWRNRTSVERVERTAGGAVIACINRSTMDEPVAVHAELLARRLQAPLVLAQVLEPATFVEGPQDPLNWGIRRHRCRERFGWLARKRAFEPAPRQVLLEGKPAEQLTQWAADHHGAILAVATRGDERQMTGLGSTTQKLLEAARASLLLVPPQTTAAPVYQKILLPLDGSCRAESVMPTVAALAGAPGAEVSVIHVVPQPELTEVGPLEPEAIELKERLNRRNEQVARRYLTRVMRYLAARDIRARPQILQGDVRHRLQQAIAEQAPDLIVVGAHGRTGSADVPCGSVTAYLADHAVAPILIVRDTVENGSAHQQDYCRIPLIDDGRR